MDSKESEPSIGAMLARREAAHITRYLRLGQGESRRQLTNERSNRQVSGVKAEAKKTYTFNFNIGTYPYLQKYQGANFVNLDPMVKLLLGLGQSSTFDQPPEQAQESVLKTVNKGVDKESQIDIQKLDELLSEAFDEGYIEASEEGVSLTEKALEILPINDNFYSSTGKMMLAELQQEINDA